MENKNVERDTNGRIMPGNSLNPNGKPKGTLGKAGRLREELAKEIPGILQTVVSQARSGDIQAARIILDRVLPPLRAQTERVELAQIAHGTLSARAGSVLSALSKGDVSPDTALQMLAALGTLAKLNEMQDLADRITALERGTQNDT